MAGVEEFWVQRKRPDGEGLVDGKIHMRGPLEERETVDTAWGPAQAEVGCYVATGADTAWVVHPDDLPQYPRV